MSTIIVKGCAIFERIFSNLSSLDALLVLLMLPILFVTTIFGWMLLIGRGKDSSQISLSALGINLNFSASKKDVERRVTDEVLGADGKLADK